MSRMTITEFRDALKEIDQYAAVVWLDYEVDDMTKNGLRFHPLDELVALLVEARNPDPQELP